MQVIERNQRITVSRELTISTRCRHTISLKNEGLMFSYAVSKSFGIYTEVGLCCIYLLHFRFPLLMICFYFVVVVDVVVLFLYFFGVCVCVLVSACDL